MLSSHWFDKANLDRYCERAGDPSFWGEPLNAISNGAFVLAGLVALILIWRRPAGSHRAMPVVLSLIVISIGIGSFLFHTTAQRWAIYADTVPIGIFMVTYLGYALRQYIGLNWLFVAAGMGVFFAALRYAKTIQCKPGLLGIAEHGLCMNGTMQYSPALVALVLVSLVLAAMRHPAWKYLLAASALFALSMTFRTIDLETCNMLSIGGYRPGTHFLWHTFNGVMLLVLLIASMRHGAPRGGRTTEL